MQAVLEKPPVVDQTELAAAAAETVTEYLKAAATPPPALAAAEPPVTDEQATFTQMHWKQSGKTLAATMWAESVTLPTSTGECLKAATTWCQPSPNREKLTGRPGNGMADGPTKLNSSGLVTTAEVADFLDWCALRIERRGWVQHTLTHQERVCAMGAIQARFHDAAGQMNENRAYSLSQTAARHLRHHLGGPIESWNDAPGRTMQEVIAAFRETAAELRSHVDPHMHPNDLRQRFPDALLAA